MKAAAGMLLLLIVLILSISPLLTELGTLATDHPANASIQLLNTVMPLLFPVIILVYAGVTIYVSVKDIS